MDVLEVLQKIGYTDLQDSGRDFRTRPLYRASDNKTSLCINKSTGEWYDFSQRTGGGIARLVQLTLNLPTLDSVKEYFGGTLPVSLARIKDSIELTDVKKFNKELLIKLSRDHEYWLNRGVSEATINTFEGGIANNGRMRHRYVFPIFNNREELVGFSGRLIINSDSLPKWKHIGSKSNWCYPLKWNESVIKASKVVVLVESIGDMLALWEAGIRNTIVTFGLDISVKIIEVLLKFDVKQIFISFNNDFDNGLVGNEAADDAKLKLLKFFDPEQITVALPDAKDFGEMNQEQIEIWRQTNHI